MYPHRYHVTLQLQSPSLFYFLTTTVVPWSASQAEEEYLSPLAAVLAHARRGPSLKRLAYIHSIPSTLATAENEPGDESVDAVNVVQDAAAALAALMAELCADDGSEVRLAAAQVLAPLGAALAAKVRWTTESSRIVLMIPELDTLLSLARDLLLREEDAEVAAAAEMAVVELAPLLERARLSIAMGDLLDALLLSGTPQTSAEEEESEEAVERGARLLRKLALVLAEEEGWCRAVALPRALRAAKHDSHTVRAVRKKIIVFFTVGLTLNLTFKSSARW
jgi:hypothetical protein